MAEKIASRGIDSKNFTIKRLKAYDFFSNFVSGVNLTSFSAFDELYIYENIKNILCSDY